MENGPDGDQERELAELKGKEASGVFFVGSKGPFTTEKRC